MPVATITSKGQITLPAAVRSALGVDVGGQIDFIAEGEGFRVVPVKNQVASLKGRFAGRSSKPVSLEAMETAIGKEALERQRRSRR